MGGPLGPNGTSKEAQSYDECKCGHIRACHLNGEGFCGACQNIARYGACTFYQKSEATIQNLETKTASG